jgi:hypothetical protein
VKASPEAEEGDVELDDDGVADVAEADTTGGGDVVVVVLGH